MKEEHRIEGKGRCIKCRSQERKKQQNGEIKQNLEGKREPDRDGTGQEKKILNLRGVIIGKDRYGESREEGNESREKDCTDHIRTGMILEIRK